MKMPPKNSNSSKNYPSLIKLSLVLGWYFHLLAYTRWNPPRCKQDGTDMYTSWHMHHSHKTKKRKHFCLWLGAGELEFEIIGTETTEREKQVYRFVTPGYDWKFVGIFNKWLMWIVQMVEHQYMVLNGDLQKYRIYHLGILKLYH